MISTTTEQPRRLDPEVTDFLFTTIQEARRVLLLQSCFLLLELLLVRSRQGFLLGFLGLEVLEHRSEVTKLELLDVSAVQLRMNVASEI